MTSSVSVSERAARRIARILQGEPSGSMLRISVEGGGCSGFQYKFGFVTERQADDVVIAGEGATVLIDETSLQYMEGAELDYVDVVVGWPGMALYVATEVRNEGYISMLREECERFELELRKLVERLKDMER